MSNGRFDDVQLSDTYELKIHDQIADDDGNTVAGYYPLSEYSGGEADLIALAMRLAIAGIVSERHGSGGPGFIILDETFGSQDADRRLAILDAFRTLRAHYGQIILVSHVTGIEASADLVLNVTPTGERRAAVVDVM